MVDRRDWRSDPMTEKQKAYIAEMREFSEVLLPPFTGKTKGEAADYIDRYTKTAHERVLEQKTARNPLSLDMGSRAENRGTHGDSSFMLNEESLSSENPPASAVGSVKTKHFGDEEKGIKGDWMDYVN